MACPGRKNLYEAKVQIKHYTLLHYTHNRIPKRVFKQDVVNPFFLQDSRNFSFYVPQKGQTSARGKRTCLQYLVFR